MPVSLPKRLAILAALAIAASLVLAASAAATEGTLEGWGYNTYGQVGDGTVGGGACNCKVSPVPVAISEATQVSGGYGHTLALRSDGTVESWGLNSYGELGDGTEASSPSPVEVEGFSNVVSVAAGTYNSLALLADGTVVAWGDNEYGELGQGTTTGPESCSGHPCSKTPIPVPGLANVVAIDSSYYYDLALLADGTVVAWGYDEYGELGDAPSTELEGCECTAHPVPVPGVSGAVAISAGWYLGSALRADGTIIDWGYNPYGETGDGEQLEYAACECRGPVEVTGLRGAVATASGGYAGFAQSADGSLRGWGYDYYEELGAELSNGCTCSTTPISLSGASGVSAVSAGAYGAAALLTGGTVETWGYGADGQLGTGGTPSHEPPAAVPGISGASGIEAGDYTDFAIIGGSQTLTANVVGGGQGTVGGERIVCPAVACSTNYPQGRVVSLRAEAAPGSTFNGFSGACTGTGVCRVRMSQAQSVTADFEANPTPPSATKIKAAKTSSKKKSASFTFKANGTVTGFECRLVRPKPKKASKAAASFSKCSSPKAYKHLKPGHYSFEVRAYNAAGHDPTPAHRSFAIKAGHAK